MVPFWWNKNVPQECSFCHSYQQKMGREVSFYFLARFCTHQTACQQLCGFSSRLSRLFLKPGKFSNCSVSQIITWWVVSFFSGCLYGSQISQDLPEFLSVLLTGFLLFCSAPHIPFPQTALFLISLTVEMWLMWLPCCLSSWLPGG